jgi:ubiquinone/menaquinone biosynthesis C-methylase UbiE
LSHTHEGFSDVDRTGDAAGFVAYLDAADASPLIRRRRSEIADRLDLRPDSRLLDVGCGTGTALIELAGRVGRAVGVDLSEELLAVARSRAPELEFLAAAATALPFGDGSFDRYRAERVYQHLTEPAAALAEARRVLTPGGRLVLMDPDWDGLVVDVDDRATLRAAIDAAVEERPTRTVARRFLRLLTDAGFEQVEVEGVATVLTDAAAATRLLLDGFLFSDAAVAAVGADRLERLRAEIAGRSPFFASLPVFLASAVR